MKLFTCLRDQLQAHVAWSCSMSSAAKVISPNLRVHHQQRPVLLQNQAMCPSGQSPALQHPGARHMRGMATSRRMTMCSQCLKLFLCINGLQVQLQFKVVCALCLEPTSQTKTLSASWSVSIAFDACKQLALLLLPLLQQQPLAGQSYFSFYTTQLFKSKVSLAKC